MAKKIQESNIRKEAYQMFLEMLDRIKKDTIEKLFCQSQLAKKEEAKEIKVDRKQTFILSRGGRQQGEVGDGRRKRRDRSTGRGRRSAAMTPALAGARKEV